MLHPTSATQYFMHSKPAGFARMPVCVYAGVGAIVAWLIVRRAYVFQRSKV